MTVYDKDVDERSEGRFAVETFTRTGGDCEDLVILIADMLMSSSHTRNWTFEYIIIDNDNPLILRKLTMLSFMLMMVNTTTS